MASSEPPQPSSVGGEGGNSWRPPPPGVPAGLQTTFVAPQVLCGIPTRVFPPYATLTTPATRGWPFPATAPNATYVGYAAPPRTTPEAHPMQEVYTDHSATTTYRHYQMQTPLATRMTPVVMRQVVRLPEQPKSADMSMPSPSSPTAGALIEEPSMPLHSRSFEQTREVYHRVTMTGARPAEKVPIVVSPAVSPRPEIHHHQPPAAASLPPPKLTEPLRRNSSSTSDFSHNYDSSSDSDHQPHVPFECAWIPLKGEDASADEPLYLDPSTQQYLRLSLWCAKYGERPRETLRAPTAVGGGSTHYSLSDDESGWPSKRSQDDGASTPPSMPDSGGRRQTFAEMVATQNELLRQNLKPSQTPQTKMHRMVSLSDVSAHTDTNNSFAPGTDVLSPSTPDPEPSGPVPLPPREPSLSRLMSGEGTEAASDIVEDLPVLPDAEEVIPEDQARQAMEEAQRQRGIAAQIDVMVNELRVLEDDSLYPEEGSERSVTQVLLSGASPVISPQPDAEPDGSVSGRLCSLNRSGLLERDVSNEREKLRRAYEMEIARLRAEAEEAKKRVEEEQRRREEEKTQSLLQLQKLQEEAARRMQRESEAERDVRERQEMQLREMARRTEQVQQLLERINASANEMAAREFLPFDKHGFTAVQLHLAKIGGFSAQAAQPLRGEVTFYAIVRLGLNDLHSPMGATLDVEAVQKASTEPLTWNETFNFPYLNERHLSVTVRAKDTRKEGNYDVQIDHLIGAARIDLGLFILNPMSCGPQVLTLFDTKGVPAATAHVTLLFSTEVLQYPFLTIKPREMDPTELNRSQTINTAYFAPEEEPTNLIQMNKGSRLDSVDSLEETLRAVDFRTLCVVKHSHRSVSLSILGIKGLKLRKKTARLSLRVGFPGGNDEWMKTSVQSVQVLATKKGRWFAFVMFNEECRFAFKNERIIHFKLLDEEQCSATQSHAAEAVEVGSASLNLQKMLMSGLTWFKERVSVDRIGGGKKQGSLDVIVHFTDSETPAPLIGPCDSGYIQPPTQSSHSRLNLSFTAPKTGDVEPRSEIEDLKARDENYRLASEAAESMPPPVLCQVTIEAATDLVPPDPSQPLSPHVHLKLGHFEAATTKGVGSCFRWNRQGSHFGFDLSNDWESQILSLECFSGDKLVGLSVIPLADLRSLPGRMFHGDLEILNKNGMLGGTLSICLQLTS